MAVAGKVASIPRGEWNRTTTYEKLDLVTYNNQAFIARQTNAGNVPVPGVTNEYWMFLLDSSGSVATTENTGKVKPDGETIIIDEDGTIHTASGSGVKDVDDNTKILTFALKSDGTVRVSNET